MHGSRRVLAAAAVLALLFAATGCTTKVVTQAPGGAAANTATASGTGKVTAAPDEATMSFGVTRQNADAKKALAQASSAAEKINAELKRQGVAAEDIQTSGVTVYPQYDHRGGSNVPKGFEASVNVTAKVKDLAKLGAVITALSKAGANTISGPGFGISDDAKYRAEAIKDAVDDAREQAKAMADAAGKKVGDVLSIASSSVNVPGPYFGAARMAAEYGTADAAVPVEPGQLDVTADVTVVFALE